MSKIVVRGFQPLFFKGVDERYPNDERKVIIVTKDADFLTGSYDWKHKTWMVQIGSYTEPVDRDLVACWSDFNPKDIFGGEA